MDREPLDLFKLRVHWVFTDQGVGMPSGETLRQLRESAGISLRAMASQLHYTPSYLSMIERGQRPIPEGLDDAYERTITDTSDMNRRDVLKLSALGLVETGRLGAAAANPRGAGRAVLSDISTMIDRIRHMEDVIGPELPLPIVRGVERLTRALASETLGRPAGVLAAEVTRYRGWLELATGHPAAADHSFDIAGALAEQFHDPDQLAHARSYRAYSARSRGDIKAAADLTDAALAVTNAHPILNVYDRYQKAELHAILGEPIAAEQTLVVADTQAEAAEKLELPSFGYWYTPGFWGLERGIVFAQLGQPNRAIREGGQGYSALPAGHKNTGWTADMLHRIDPDWAA